MTKKSTALTKLMEEKCSHCGEETPDNHVIVYDKGNCYHTWCYNQLKNGTIRTSKKDNKRK